MYGVKNMATDLERRRHKPICMAFVLKMCYLLCLHTTLTYALNPAEINIDVKEQQRPNELSSYLDLAVCFFRTEPWKCARQQSARVVDIWNAEVYQQWQKLQVAADRELNTTLQKRGFSASVIPNREKPSTILKEIEIGTRFMKDSLIKSMDEILGRDKEINKNDENNNINKTKKNEDYDGNDDDNEGDDDDNEEEEIEGEVEDDNDYNERTEHTINIDNVKNEADVAHDIEFLEVNEQLKHTGFNRKKNKMKKNKKKGQQGHFDGSLNTQPATVLLVQQNTPQPAHDHVEFVPIEDNIHDDHNINNNKPNKMKKRKQKGNRRKKHKYQADGIDTDVDDTLLSSLLNQDNADNSGFGLIENLLDGDSWLTDAVGAKRKKGHMSFYGRSNGVMRGKKKKKKKAIMKLVLLGSFLKAKIELLLKILGAHLQIKFFAIALIGLLINIARFWIDVKRGGSPNKVVYVEHAHHQHHYEDHGEEWNEPGGYWKRSLQKDSSLEDANSTDGYQPVDDSHYLAYRNQWQQQ